MEVDFVAYKLPFDKSKVKSHVEYMRHGGNQLIEIMEKEFSYEWIMASWKSLGITEKQIECFEVWCDNDCAIGVVTKILEFKDTAQAKSFMAHGGGMLKKLMKLIDFTPVLNEDETVTSKYSFIKYTKYGSGNYIVVKSEPNMENWLSNKLENSYKKMISKYHFFIDSKLIDHTHPMYKDCQNSASIYEKLAM